MENVERNILKLKKELKRDRAIISGNAVDRSIIGLAASAVPAFTAYMRGSFLQTFNTRIYAITNKADALSRKATEQIMMDGEKIINLGNILLLLPAGVFVVVVANFIKRYKTLKSGLTKKDLEKASSFMDKVHADMKKPAEEMDASLGYARDILNQDIAKELPMKEKVELINMLGDCSEKHGSASMEEYSISRHRVEEFLYNQEHGRKKDIGVSKKKEKVR